MISFVAAVAALSLLVVGLITRPLLFQRKQGAEVDPARLNASLLTEELALLEGERVRGAMSSAEYAEARDDLARRVLDEAKSAESGKKVEKGGKPFPTIAGIVLVIPLCAGLLYSALGTPNAIGFVAPQQANGHMGGVEDMVGSLAAKLAANPDNPQGWAMLARSYTVMGRYDEAVAAYEKIGDSLEKSSAWLSEYADALAMKAGGNPMGRPEELAQQALKLDPDNLLALMMTGYGAASRADFDKAVPLIEHALKLVQPGTDDEKFLQDLLSKSHAQMAKQPGGKVK
jgi:cytochrome c-type biogenesis protein CcmH